MGSAANFNSVLETLHRMHKQFADLMEQVNGGLRRIRGTEQRIAEMQAVQDAAVKAALNQRIAVDGKQALLEENEKGIARKKKLQDEAKNEKEFNNFRDQIAAAEAANAVLSEEILEDTDVLVWWGHCKHHLVPEEIVTRVQRRVLRGDGADRAAFRARVPHHAAAAGNAVLSALA